MSSVSTSSTGRPYDVIFLDWYGTLSATHFWNHWQHTQRDLHPALIAAFIADDKQTLNPWMRGELTSEEYSALLADETKIDAKLILDGLRESSQNFTFINPTLPALLLQLRQAGYRVVIAIDNMDSFRRWTVPSLDLDSLVDDLLISAELGALKSDVGSADESLFFDAYLKQHSIQPHRSILIDDLSDLGFLSQHGIDILKINKGDDISPQLEDLLNFRQPQELTTGA